MCLSVLPNYVSAASRRAPGRNQVLGKRLLLSGLRPGAAGSSRGCPGSHSSPSLLSQPLENPGLGDSQPVWTVLLRALGPGASTWGRYVLQDVGDE